MHFILSAVLLLTAVLARPVTAQWSQKEGPLTTRWAADVDPGSVLPEYPRPQMVREQWLNLNGLWQFSPASERDQPPVGRDLDREILVPFPVESALSGVKEHHERLWYRRTFEVPATWDRRRVLLHFGAVDWEARVWVNGELVGEHRGGYDPFSFDITDALREEGEQEIIVGVWDPTDKGTQPRGKQVLEPKGIWYTPTTGIWQTVWLEPVPQPRERARELAQMQPEWIRDITITPDVDGSRFLIRADVESIGGEPTCGVEVVLFESGMMPAHGKPTAVATGRPGEEIVLPVPAPHLWSPDSPYLYRLQVTLFSDRFRRARVYPDAVASYAALRSIRIDADDAGVPRLFLNGEPYFMIGTLDQGFWPDGLYTAPTDEALKYDIEITKAMGFNTIRKHVKVEPARWYSWCDSIGILVWQDMPSGDRYIRPDEADIERTPESAQQFERELLAMIDSLRNHPSIVMWVPFNEGWGQYDTARITDLVREADPSRLINSASGWTDRGTGDVHDIHAYPGPAAPAGEEKRAGALGEFGGLGLPIEGHTWAPEGSWGYQGMRTAEELARRYESLMRGVHDLKARKGLAAVIYTQITDVETETNGLLTYDRAVIKVDPRKIAAANAGRFPTLVTILACAASNLPSPSGRGAGGEGSSERILWRYMLDEPPDGWTDSNFDDSDWMEGIAGFGRAGTPGAIIGTEWNGSEIWLRRAFELDDLPEGDLRLLIHHDEDAEVYINGVLAAELTGYTTMYEDVPMSDAAKRALRKGRNTIAVHCRQTRGGQYIDAGIVRLVPGSTEGR